jgi:hypothetical protein
MRFINRRVPISDVARALDLRLDGAGKIHCWHADRHQHGDRTALVNIRRRHNTVKCLGCDSRPMGLIDLVMDVLGLAVGDAAMWISERFEVPTIPAGKRPTEPDRSRGPVGYERGLELLVRSGLFGTLSEPARSIAPVLLAMSEEKAPIGQELSVRISYAAIARYSGVRSPNTIRRALLELAELGLIELPEAGHHRSPRREASLYVVTPNSDVLQELAQSFSTFRRELRLPPKNSYEPGCGMRRLVPGGTDLRRRFLQCRCGEGGSVGASPPHPHSRSQKNGLVIEPLL